MLRDPTFLVAGPLQLNGLTMMLTEWYLWSCANEAIRQHQFDAPIFAAMRADELFEQGDEDGTWIRRDLTERQGAVPNIPSKANGRWTKLLLQNPLQGRNAVERILCRLKDYPRIATPLRQVRRQLPRGNLPRRRHQTVVKSPNPRAYSTTR